MFLKLKKSLLSVLTIWMYGGCWCWKMQSIVLHAADAQECPFIFICSLHGRICFPLTVCLTPLVKKSPHLWYFMPYCSVYWWRFQLIPRSAMLLEIGCSIAESFSVQPALRLLFERLLLYVYYVSFMCQRYRTTLAAVFGWLLPDLLGNPKLSHCMLILVCWS